MGIVSDYQTRFERLLARADTLIDKQEVECFINGLKDGLRADVRIQNPQNLSSAIGLARWTQSLGSEASNQPNILFFSSQPQRPMEHLNP